MLGSISIILLSIAVAFSASGISDGRTDSILLRSIAIIEGLFLAIAANKAIWLLSYALIWSIMPGVISVSLRKGISVLVPLISLWSKASGYFSAASMSMSVVSLERIDKIRREWIGKGGLMSERLLIVGGVAGGTAAASRARRVNPELEIVLFEQGPHISYAA